MQRLAALVPRPRLHLIRFHGVLAPNAKLRAQVVPKDSELTQAAQPQGALPELRRRAEDRRGDPGGTSDREDPHPSGRS